MPVSQTLLSERTNNHIVANAWETIAEAVARLPNAFSMWWHLVVDHGDRRFSVIKFSDLQAQAVKSGDVATFVQQRLETLTLPVAATASLNMLSDDEALSLAENSLGQVLVVLENGRVAGIVYTGTTRGLGGFNTQAPLYDAALQNRPQEEATAWQDDDEFAMPQPAAETPPEPPPSVPPPAPIIPQPAPIPVENQPVPGTAGEEVQFTAYYPREAVAGVRSGLYVYTHLAGALELTQKDVRKFIDELGGSIPAPRTAKQTARLQRGTVLTVTPECDDVEFNPPSLTKSWDDDYTRFEFEFKPAASLIGEPLIGAVGVSVGGVEIASVKFVCDVVEKRSPESSILSPAPSPTPPENPLAAAELRSESAALYQRIFISYSRKDVEVVETYRKAQLALGNEVFMDTYSIRSGEDWQAALARGIRDAEIFQLFWSENSAASSNVRDEWEYALEYKCAETRCDGFIRPVFWTKPMPVKPPEELGHLNFKYIPLGE